MRVPLIAVSLLLAAGCSGDHGHIAGDRARSTASTTPMAATSAMLARRATSPTGFASLPDRGELMAYVPGQQAARRSAYTWHPVRLSEAHALNAIVGGELVVRAPDGRPIRLRYERHVEHDDGNWTWIGREEGAVPGSEAILTFGEKAVFGSIPNGTGLPYRLTSAAGRAWLLETDRDRLARTVNAATRPEVPDFLLPPRIEGLAPRLAAGPQAQLSTGAAPSVGAMTTSGTTVDLLLGYTAAFATRLGGQSQAMTRLNNLVDVTNVAYANSQIDAEVRLVRAVQVNYADNTSNEDALYDLTGVECTEQSGGGLSCSFVGVPESLQPLHAARDQYGADLVSLVRNFNDPENDGCGLAWINGGGQLPITADDDLTGLSVIGDSNGMGGPGSFPDNGYICRDETLAHELGHNMGSAHDRDAAKGDDNILQSNEYGRYPYSFGYKSGAGNFFTVMAYGDSGQTPYRVFSNPAINYCGGNPCGIANTADNARSLRQTIPIIVQFRMAIRDPVANDFDGDGRADIFWRSSSGGNVIWRSGIASSQLSVASLATSWAVKGVADFDGDGVSDVFWRNDVGNNIIWKSANASTRQYVSSVSPAWTAAGVGDFNGDGRSDILWRNSAGNNIVWLSANASTKLYVSTVGTHWSIAGIGDFNGDGRSDILWRNTAGNNIVWLSANALTKQYVSSLGAHWNVVGVGDFNGDGRSDILWRNSSGNNATWLSANATTQQYVSSVGTYWSVAAVEDFDGDGRSDILWRNAGGGNIIWLGTNAGQQQYVSSVGTHWSVESGKVRW